jgi:hypothetical protein
MHCKPGRMSRRNLLIRTVSQEITRLSPVSTARVDKTPNFSRLCLLTESRKAMRKINEKKLEKKIPLRSEEI